MSYKSTTMIRQLVAEVLTEIAMLIEDKGTKFSVLRMILCTVFANHPSLK